MTGRIREIEAHEFQAEVLDQEFAVVDFYSDECPPCEALAPKYHALSELYGDRVRFVKIFRQRNRDLALSLGVKSSPTVLFYRRGERVGPVLAGGIRRSQIAREIDSFLPADEVGEIRARTPRSRTECDILVLGGGPAGLTAAIYAAQAKRRTILLDPALTGGQVTITHMVSNYPGFPEPVAGWQLGHQMSEQARRAGAEIRQAVELTRVDLDAREVEIDGVETIAAKRIILATGSSPRLLGVPGEREYRGKGISYCATCDGKYFEGKELVVVGGGSSALEEAQFLTTFASKVTIVHRGPRESLRATGTAQEKALANPKISFLLEHEIRAFRKLEDGMEVVAFDKRAGSEETLATDGVFIFIGMRPNLENFEERFTLDEGGYVVTDALQRTGVPGVFAVGDISAKPFRQITIAAAEGTIAGIQAAKEVLEEEG